MPPTPPLLLLDIPFNELPGSVVAEDYSPSNANADIVDGQFVEGRVGRAVHFGREGYANVVAPVIPLAGEWTLSVWLRAELTPNGPRRSWVLLKFAGANRYVYLDLETAMTQWTYLVLLARTDRLVAMVNARLVGAQLFPAGWGKPTGFCVVNDNPAGLAGHSTMEELRVYEGIVDDELILPDFETMTLNYYINQVDFLDFGVRVSASEGLIENLSLKEGFKTQWDGHHGEVVDLSKPRYEVRDITLSCFCYGLNAGDFVDRIKGFLNAFRRPGLSRLMLKVAGKVFVYEVYLPTGINLKKQWSDAGMVGTFELRLREPEPVKRVLKFTGTGTASITLTSAKVVNVYWGDDSKTLDVYGTNKAVSHTYTTPGDHYIVVTGVIEDITAFTHNATVVWSLI